MFSKIKLLIAVIKTFLFISKTAGYVVFRLGGECIYDKECQQNDPNSFCSFHNQGFICICKNNYRITIFNNTEKCVFSDFPEEEREGLTAAPIILCFLICVLVEGFCLLAFRYWKKQRSRRHDTLRMQTITLTEFSRFSHSRSDPVVSLTILPNMESMISSTPQSFPPPYSQTVILGTHARTQKEDSPPSYDEAIKQYIPSSTLEPQEQNHRKLSV